ncbi:MAG TPA: hypothetical protein VFD21_19030 [Vicinamibacterales bacterium]|nr:hypothetical protein [Vicinamibacterales bacterium]
MQNTIRAGLTLGALVLAATAAVMAGQAGPAVSTAAPTFAKDVAPIVFKNCAGCHRPGESAPMSLLTYADARPWARAMSRRVAEGSMPPWHADAESGTFENERRLTADEKAVMTRWADAGAPEGDPKDLPAAPTFADGWSIGTPDAVFQMAEDYAVPASGTIQYQYFTIPTNFTETKWVQAIEVRPGNRALVHHVLVYYPAPASTDNALSRVLDTGLGGRGGAAGGGRGGLGNVRRLIATYAPGTAPQVFPPGTAMRLPPGGTLMLQMHYTSNGTAGTDRSKVGIIFAKEPPTAEIEASQFINTLFTIPAGAADHRVDASVGFAQDAVLWGIFPHTHVRGKRWSYTLALPDGTMKPLLSVPKYDFNWQTYYMFKEPLEIPKGSRILSSAWYDNSPANRSNPDPTKAVRWGDQTWEEMQYTGLLYSAKK